MDKNSISKEFMAELIGTFILIVFGVGSVAMVTLFPSHPKIPGEIIKGGYTNVVLGWGLGVALGVMASVRISGAHLNPAVTIALVLVKKFPALKIFHYILAQILGAFLGALVIFIVFYAKWKQIDPTLGFTEGVMSTYPAVKGFWPGFIDQVFGTFMLMFLILTVVDQVKDPANNIAFPFIIGAIILAIGISLGGMNGYAINPARDLGPRLILLLAGFKNTGFNSYVFLIPIFGPIVGAFIGALFYKFTIGKMAKSK